jgi:manganese transport protein
MADARALSEVHSSVETGHASTWRRWFAFAGPAYLVSVGYMDPGNWATDIQGGAQFGYRLLWVLVLSNGMAVLLQTLGARLGIVSGRDLAQACRESYPRRVTLSLWVLCEIAIAACDLAEVLGAAIALNLLFHLPLILGVLLTAADTLVLLTLQRFGIRKIEAFILSLVVMIGVCFLIEILLAKPEFGSVMAGMVPRLDSKSLYIAIGIIGATVMPHNLYLHSALVQTRRIADTVEARETACRYNLFDSVIALCAAMLVNMAILIMAAATFFTRGQMVEEIQQAYQLLTPILGAASAGVFAFALLCSGQSSTLTGTMAGQIIMEGFLNLRIRPWIRRIVTRMLAIVPAVLTIHFAGSVGVSQLIVLSQVVLSMQLPFAVIPLIHFTNDRTRMGQFANRAWVRVLAWLCAAAITGLNSWLFFQAVQEWAKDRPWVWFVAVPLGVALGWLLIWITFQPTLYQWRRRFLSGELARAEQATGPFPAPAYSRILVPLDHSSLDRVALAHAAALAHAHHARLFLLHVEEDITSQVYGSLASTAEVEAGRDYFSRLVRSLDGFKLDVEMEIRFSSDAKREIVRYAREIRPDLIVMGAHGHRQLKDLIFGNTIDPVRHALRVPILVVRDDARV